MSIRWAVFVSGSGTNLQNFLDLESSQKIKNSQIVAVFADRECLAIERARKKNKATLVLSPKTENFKSQVFDFLNSHQVNRIFLLGYMRILSADFISDWKKPIINLHPSLLPRYPGLLSIEKAFAAGDAYFGVSLHEVTAELDAGPLVLQISFPRGSASTLAAATELVHRYEYRIVSDYLMDLELESS